MATDTTDNLEETEEEFIEEPAGAPERTGPYTIAGRVGDDLEAQVRRADWHCQVIAECDVLEKMLTAPIREEIERLQARLNTVIAPFASRRARHEGAIQWWVLEENIRERVDKTINLAHGIVKTRKTQGKTVVSEDAVMSLYLSNKEDFAHLIQPKVDTKEVRECYELREGGTCVDKLTGEVLEAAVILQTEEPGIKVTVVALGPGRDVAADHDDQQDDDHKFFWRGLAEE